MRRRTFLAASAAALAALRAHAGVEFGRVVRRPLVFPRDHGSHPEFRTEWWYVTGWTRDGAGVERGVQITFFRTRPGVAEGVRSAFAPVQVIFAHAAIADPALERLRYDQRAARAVLGLAGASEQTTAVTLDDWSLTLHDDEYRAHIPARDFTLDLAFRAGEPPLLQGEDGISRKGAEPAQASYYYSRPQLALRGTIAIGDRKQDVEGIAWLDHEWSSEYLAPEARGWDWTGIDLDDGGALMAFRIRDTRGARLRAAATLREGRGQVQRFDTLDVRFEAPRYWRSPRTNIEYPVGMRVRAGDFVANLTPLFDDQELDARATVGTVYWEGAVRASDANGRSIGRGYLELTGYGEPLKL